MEEVKKGEKSPVASPEAPKKRWKLWVATHLILILAGAGIFVWKTQTEKALNETHQKALKSITENANEHIKSNEEAHLRRQMQTLVWAVSGAWQDEDHVLVREYFKAYVKHPGINSVALVNTKGEFVVTTDVKLEGEKYTGPYAKVFARKNEMLVEYNGDRNEYLVSAPLLGPEGFIGYIFFLYEPELFEG